MAKADEGFPHLYKEQRRFERDAKAARERQLSSDPNASLPPICGFTYKPRPPKKKPPGWTDAPVQCMRTAGAGTDHQGRGYCDYHEVQAHRETAKGKKTGTKDVQEAKKVAYANASFFGERRPVDPHEALLTEISRTTSIIEWLERHMDTLQEDGISKDGILAQYSKQNGWVPSVWMTLLQEERGHLVRTATAAIKAGVAERRVQIAEQQGQLIVAMMMSFIHDPELGLSAQQIGAAPALIKKHILGIRTEEKPEIRNGMKVLEVASTEA